MSRTDICTYCGRDGHTASSCPRAAKDRANQHGRVSLLLLCLVAALAFAGGYQAGPVIDGLFNSATNRKPIKPTRDPIRTTLWRVTVNTWLHEQAIYEIRAAHHESAIDAVEVMWPDYRWLDVEPLEA